MKRFIYVVLNLEDMTEEKINIIFNTLQNITSPIILRGSASNFGANKYRNIVYDDFIANTVDFLCKYIKIIKIYFTIVIFQNIILLIFVYVYDIGLILLRK